MKKRLLTVGVLILSLASAFATLAANRGAAAQTGNGTQPFADPAFQRVWNRTDLLVQQGHAGRSWYWGPTPRTSTQEPNQESPGGQRLVQYFDKSRMEINDPNADQNSGFYVTNGLLTVELISGNMQIGAAAFSPRTPACINIAGDSDDPGAPTYFSFRSVSSVGGGIDHPASDLRGTTATATLDRNGNLGNDPSKASIAAGAYIYYEPATKHNIPQVFWTFLNQPGLVIENGMTVTRQLSMPWFYASGYPVSDAYWAHVKVAGQFQDVLIQAFQRRVLTYNPSNTPAFQVEMGNIGLHYYDWRYNNIGTCPPNAGTPVASATAGANATATSAPAATSTPSATSTPGPSPTAVPLSGKIVWVSDRSGKKHLWSANPDGTTPTDLTAGSTADNYDPAFSPDGSKIAFVSNRAGPPEIYVMLAGGGAAIALTHSADGETNQHPAWSRDGAKIAFASDHNQIGDRDIWVVLAAGGTPVNITRSAGADYEPTWAGDSIVFTSERSGSPQLYITPAGGSPNPQLITTRGTNYQATWSPVNRRFLFVSTRDGNPEIFAMDDDFNNQTRVTDLLSLEYEPTWSPDAHYIAYTSNRDGNNEIYISYLDGSHLTRVTNDPGNDTHPTWR
ncbi:MAG: LpqB family beta-propeller domain-containing protein [Chloroflexia bacterium]